MTPTQIKTLRRTLSLTTSDFGARVGVSGRTVEQWEQGRRTPGGAATKMLEQIVPSDMVWTNASTTRRPKFKLYTMP